MKGSAEWSDVRSQNRPAVRGIKVVTSTLAAVKGLACGPLRARDRRDRRRLCAYMTAGRK